MQQFLADSLAYIVLALLILTNTGGVLMVIFQLPGTWVILLATAATSLFYHEYISWFVVGALLLLAISGEVVEMIGSSAGAKRSGGTKRAMLLATVCSIGGAIIGTFTPLSLVGTVLGACLGAAGGGLLGDRWAGRSWDESLETGKGAAVGRLWSTAGKVGVAAVMWLVVTVAIFWP